MSGLIYKDFSSLMNYYAKFLLIIMLVFCFTAVSNDSNYILLCMIMISSVYFTSVMSYDEYSHWDRYARTLPLSRAQIVGEKYILATLCNCVTAVAALAMCIVCSLFRGSLAADIAADIVVMLVMLAISFLYNAVSLPIIYKFGASHSRTFMLVVVLGIGCAVPLLAKLATGAGIKAPGFVAALAGMGDGAAMLLFACVVIGALLLCIFSFAVSLKIYNATEY